MGVEELVLAALVVAVGACLQGTIGFGMGMFSAPILAMLDPDLVPVPLLMLGVGLATIAAVRERHNLDVFGLTWGMVGRVPGTVAGAAAVALLPTSELRIVFGVAILSVVALSVIGWRPAITRRSLLTVGVASGFMGTTTSVGGPPFALLYQNASGQRVRATLAWYLMLGSSLALLSLMIAGEVTLRELGTAALLAPCVLVGFVAARWVAPWVDEGRTRVVVLAFTSAAAGWLVVQSVVLR